MPVGETFGLQGFLRITGPLKISAMPKMKIKSPISTVTYGRYFCIAVEIGKIIREKSENTPTIPRPMKPENVNALATCVLRLLSSLESKMARERYAGNIAKPHGLKVAKTPATKATVRTVSNATSFSALCS